MSIGKNKQVIRLMKDELGGMVMSDFVVLGPRTYSYLKAKAKGTKYCVTKRILKFNDYKNCLLSNKIVLNYKKDLKVNYIIYTLKKLTKIGLSSNDDKRLKNFDRVTSYPYDTSVGKVCKSEIPSKYISLTLIFMQMKIKQDII